MLTLTLSLPLAEFSQDISSLLLNHCLASSKWQGGGGEAPRLTKSHYLQLPRDPL